MEVGGEWVGDLFRSSGGAAGCASCRWWATPALKTLCRRPGPGRLAAVVHSEQHSAVLSPFAEDNAPEYLLFVVLAELAELGS